VDCDRADRLTQAVWWIDEITLDEIHPDGAQGLKIALRLHLFGNHPKTRMRDMPVIALTS
jgi:hypothetical protein